MAIFHNPDAGIDDIVNPAAVENAAKDIIERSPEWRAHAKTHRGADLAMTDMGWQDSQEMNKLTPFSEPQVSQEERKDPSQMLDDQQDEFTAEDQRRQEANPMYDSHSADGSKPSNLYGPSNDIGGTCNCGAKIELRDTGKVEITEMNPDGSPKTDTIKYDGDTGGASSQPMYSSGGGAQQMYSGSGSSDQKQNYS